MAKTKSYSGLFIIDPAKSDTFDDVKGSIGAIIKENSGEVVKENVMGKKMLAYPIQKKTEGIYYEVVFNAQPEAIAKMTREFQISGNILRTIIDRQGKQESAG